MSPDKRSQEEIFAEIQNDVTISYDEVKKIFNITSGKITYTTTSNIREYFKNADGQYDDASILIGSDVIFGTVIVDGINHAFVPNFSGFKCNVIDIQSQNLVSANGLFYHSEADTIRVADQPNLKSVNDMFEDCKARRVVLGKIPAGISGSNKEDKQYMFRDCNSVVTDLDLVNTTYEPI